MIGALAGGRSVYCLIAGARGRSAGAWSAPLLRPQIWKVPLFDELEPALRVAAPRAGYVVDGGFALAGGDAKDRVACSLRNCLERTACGSLERARHEHGTLSASRHP